MGDANEDRAKAAEFPDGDLLGIILTQHAEVKDLMSDIAAASGEERKELFSTLVTTLKAHETAEESVVRPITEETAGASVADARNAEEAEANEVIAALIEARCRQLRFRRSVREIHRGRLKARRGRRD